MDSCFRRNKVYYCENKGNHDISTCKILKGGKAKQFNIAKIFFMAINSLSKNKKKKERIKHHESFY